MKSTFTMKLFSSARTSKEYASINIKFLLNELPLSPNHEAPPAEETQQIVEDLIRMNNAEHPAITTDSQPGCYNQKAYVVWGICNLLGPKIGNNFSWAVYRFPPAPATPPATPRRALRVVNPQGTHCARACQKARSFEAGGASGGGGFGRSPLNFFSKFANKYPFFVSPYLHAHFTKSRSDYITIYGQSRAFISTT